MSPGAFQIIHLWFHDGCDDALQGLQNSTNLMFNYQMKSEVNGEIEHWKLDNVTTLHQLEKASDMSCVDDGGV